MQSPNQTYLDKTLAQLQITPKDNEERQELEQILFHKLCYPSTELALLHMESDRLGILDERKDGETEGEIGEGDEGKMGKGGKQGKQGDVGNSLVNVGMKKCKCCGLYWQQQRVSMCTSFFNIKNVGISSRLFFIAITHTTFAFLIMFLIYCLYAIISNLLSCNYSADSLNQQYQSARYMKLIGDWLFNISLLGNVSCMTSSAAYQAQCWLGLGAIVVVAGVFAGLKFRKLGIITDLKRQHNSVQNLTILIQNLPINLTKPHLQTLLQTYQKSLPHPLPPHHSTPIQIAKLNRAAPFYLSSSLFNNSQAKKANQRYEKAKEKIVDLVKGRMKKGQFWGTRAERDGVYGEFQEAKRSRIVVFQRIVMESILKKKEENQHRVVTAPTFVTFQSSYNKSFILQNHSNLPVSTNSLYFNVPNSPKKFKAIIQDPPSPQQVIWTNFGQSHRQLFKKKLIIFIITIIFLAGTGAGLYYLQKSNFEFALKNQGKRSPLVLSFIVSIAIIVITYVNAAILIGLSQRERNITYMDLQASLSNKVTLCQIGHFIVVPLVFNLFFTTQYTGVVSLSQTVFFLSLQSAFIFPFLKILDPLYLYNRLRKHSSKSPTSKLPQTQIDLNKNFQYMQFGIGFQFSYLIRATLFTCFYAPLQPIIVVFAIVGMIVTYWVFKYCLLYRSTRPISGNRLVNISLSKYLAFGPVLFAVGSLVWPYYIKREFIGLVPCILQIVISFILYLIPLQSLVQKFYNKIQKKDKTDLQQILYSQNKYNFEYQYDRLNYMTAHQATVQYNSQKNKQKQSTNMGYLNLIGNILGHVGMYDLLNNSSSKFNNIEENSKGEMGMGGRERSEEERLRQETEDIVYANQRNDNAVLIGSILEYIKNNIDIICGIQGGNQSIDEGMGSAAELRKGDRIRDEGDMDGIKELNKLTSKTSSQGLLIGNLLLGVVGDQDKKNSN